MASARREGAPRLINWTGERRVPWATDIQVVYEHYHRYLWAAQLVDGKRVLDLASGGGFGSALLSEVASGVTGVDVDEISVRHAQLNYRGDNLEYRTADARDLSQFAAASFDVVIAFELIEHVTESDLVLAEIKRVLVPDGFAVVSTPHQPAYAAASEANQFHVNELARESFEALLLRNFAEHRLWARHVVSGSQLRALTHDEHHPQPSSRLKALTTSSFLIEPDGDEWVPAASLPLFHMVAIASNGELPQVPEASSLSKAQLTMLGSRLAELAGRLDGTIADRDIEIDARDAEIQARGRAIQTLDREVADGCSRVRDWQGRYQRLALNGFIERTASALRLAEREAAHLRAAEDALAREHALGGEIAHLRAQLYWSDYQLRGMRESIIWRFTMRLRGKLIASLGGRGSVLVRMLQVGLRCTWRLAQRGSSEAGGTVHENHRPELEPERAGAGATFGEDSGPGANAVDAPAFEPVQLELADEPLISIVMPLYAGAKLTHRALQTIRDNTFSLPYEVILVNDGDDEGTARLLQVVDGVRILSNQDNLGYLRSINRGAQIARGRWLVLANNDIEVLPDWAAELVDCGESADDIAIVAPMYLQPDGRICEAGGIIWDDASGHTYGRGDHPQVWRYGWRREIDYGSAAALLVRNDVWREIGGFDERFLPMYYEDVDLCFTARARGYRVMYEPHARVIHREGSSAGIDESEGHKRHQALNRPRFRDKWEDVLAHDHLPRPKHPWDDWAGATARRGDRVLFVDHRMLFWDREAGALRTLEILKSLIESGHHVTFLPDNGANNEPYSTELQRMGIEVMFGPDLLTQLSMVIAPYLHAAIVSRPTVAARYMTLLRRHAPDAELIYDTVDLHWVREAREAAVAVGHHEAELLTQEALWTQSLELALIRAADVTLVATDLERNRVEAEVPGAKVRILPTINPVRENAPGLAERNGVIFVGGFEHTPNIDAVLRLVNDVMPEIWEMLPDVTLRVVGAAAPPKILALASDRVEILGWVPDLDPLLDAARVTVAPLSWGAGMKGKITQALAFGLPVVTTPVGAEGLTTGAGEALLVGADDAALARHAISVLTDDALWRQLAAAGRDLVAQQCSPQVVTDLMDELLSGGAPVVGRR